MPVELNSPVTEQEQVLQPERKIEVVDISGIIKIGVDKHKVDFSYNCYQYQRDENGTILLDADNKKKVTLIKTKSLTVGDDYYSTAFSETITSITRAESIEGKLLDWIKQFDTELQNIDTTYVNNDDLSTSV